MSTPIAVLLVEDSPTDAKLVQAELRRTGRTVIAERVDDRASLEAALARQPWDVVISDWSMPNFSGGEALALLRASGSDAPFLIVSGTVGEEAAVAAMRHGASDYVVKDKLSRLAPAVERALRESQERIALRAAEERLRTQDARYRALLERSTDIIALTDGQHRIVYVNPAVTVNLGFVPDELLGRNALDLVRTADRPRMEDMLAQLETRDRGTLVAEFRALHKDGRERWLEATATNLLADPAVGGVVWNLRDITDRRAALDLLQASEQRYRRIIETTSEGVWVIDPGGRTVFVNARMASMLGYEPSEVVNRPVFEFLDAMKAREVVAMFRERRAGISGVGETMLRTKNGSVRHVIVESTAIFDDAGNYEGVLGMVRDVTESRAAAEALVASEARFARLSQSGLIGVATTDLAGTIHDMNETYASMLGYTREELLSGHYLWTEMTPPEWRARDREVIASLAVSGVSLPWEKELVRKDGTRLPVLVGVAMLDPKTCIVFLADLSAQKRAEAALRQSEAQLRQAQKMEAMGRLAGGVAHDFNNVLSVILSYSEMLAETAAPEAREDLDEIRKAAMRATELTRQLLVFSRQQVVAPAVVDPATVLANMDRMLRRLVGEDVDLRCVARQDAVRIRIDAGQLEQVVMNLVINARDAMPRGGKITVELSQVDLDQEFSNLHLGVTAGPYVMLAVSDTGCGMDKATLTRIFEPFFTTKETGKGTGLGLSTVFGIVQNSGGTVWVYSEPGLGSTFKMYLPLVSGELDRLVVRPAPAQLSGTETILLVEDEEQVRAVAADILVRGGYRVLVATDPAHAIELARSHPQHIDLLVSDVVMPVMSGPELARAIVAVRPTIKILHISGYTDDSIVRHGMVANDVPFLQKPLTPDALKRKVREVLDLP